jgi:hypothetical protein
MQIKENHIMEMQNIGIAIESEDRAEYPQLAHLYDDDGYLLVEYGATAMAELDHYGVPGSPTFWVVEDYDFDWIEINGETYTEKDCPEEVVKCCIEAIMKKDWEEA